MLLPNMALQDVAAGRGGRCNMLAGSGNRLVLNDKSPIASCLPGCG